MRLERPLWMDWVCASRETPICSPRFPFRSISLHILKYSAREHHHFTVFAVPETIIFEISLPTAGLLSRAPRARSGAPHFHPQANRARSGRGACFSLPRRSGVIYSGRPECQPDASYSPFRPTGIFTLELPELAPEPRIIMNKIMQQNKNHYFHHYYHLLTLSLSSSSVSSLWKIMITVNIMPCIKITRHAW